VAFDGSAKGVPAELDLDAAQRAATGNNLLLSFDGSGSVGGVACDDEDVVAFDPVASTFSMYFDGSVSDPTDWPAADLVGLPEPGAGASLLDGVAALGALRIWRRRCRDSRLSCAPCSRWSPRARRTPWTACSRSTTRARSRAASRLEIRRDT